ncbi:MAG: hypothetical protein JSW27_02770 [Phycisphaerales bacterium]|nr:MAG: hypothetical protein JSW27_02770 [Phycisphaerales bacterium]
MENPITKLAIAAAVIGAVVLGLFEFIGTDTGSGVVWAEVAQKVQASCGLILRCTETCSFLDDDTDYAIKYFDPTHSRTDSYKDGQIVRSHYFNSEAMTFTGIYHTRKHYLTTQHSGDSEGFLENNEDWLNPRYLVQAIMSAEHEELGQKTIDGILCEGLETTDPNVLGPLPGLVTRLEVEMRLWVDVSTRYPALFEGKMDGEAEGQTLSSEWVMDQFQWEVALAPSVFEPNIPPDYEDMRNL